MQVFNNIINSLSSQNLCQTISIQSGSNIMITNGEIWVNGKKLGTKEMPAIILKVEGAANDIKIDVGAVEVQGHARNINTVSGDVKCGSVSERVQTTSGDVEAGDVAGFVQTVSGDVHCRSIQGECSTVSGDIG